MSAVQPGLVTNFDEEIARVTAELTSAAFPKGLRAVVLTGSLARGEGTWSYEGDKFRLAGDAEFLMVFHEGAALPPQEQANAVAGAIETRLLFGGATAHIVLSPVDPGYLRSLRPHIFAYELLAHGKVVWGDPHILQLATVFEPEEIPLEDGFRLLSNRMIELLEALCDEEQKDLAQEANYRALKLSLDLGSSLLLFERQYESTYRARAARLAELAAASDGNRPLAACLAASVVLATRRKLGESVPPDSEEPGNLTGLIWNTRSLWRWELEQLTGAVAGDRELVRLWARQQDIPGRLRGWASVARRCGTMLSVGRAPRWVNRFLEGSPRRLIYAAASELFFELPALLCDGRPTRTDEYWNELLSTLPAEAERHGSEPCAWRRLGQAISWNYHTFLEFTRS